MPDSELHIIGEHFERVNHHLLALPGAKLAEIRMVRSHVHALSQCRKLIRALGIEPVVAADTAGAAAELAQRRDPSVAVIEDDAALADTSVNKVVAGFADPSRPARALYFSKAVVPWGEGPHYEHIGLYAYRRAALERFVGLPRGVLEQRERLEQLRALEAGMRISVSLIEAARLGVQVDTPADLERARQLMQQMQTG